MSNKTSFIMALGYLPFIYVILRNPENYTATVLMGLYGIIHIFCVIYQTVSKNTEEQELQKKTEKELLSYISFDKETGILYLYKRTPLLSNAIKIVDDEDFEVKYKPKTLNIRTMSSYGFSKTEANITGGYNYVSSVNKNGLCNICYGKNGDRVRAISLLEEDFKDAICSPIATYLDENSKQIIIQKNIKISDTEWETAVSSIYSTGFASNNFLRAGKPSREKAEKILNWLTTVPPSD